VDWRRRTSSSLSCHAWNIEDSSAILFLKHLSALPQPPPVVVLSASHRPEAAAAAFANGAIAFFGKPIKFEDLDELLAFALATPCPREGAE